MRSRRCRRRCCQLLLHFASDPFSPERTTFYDYEPIIFRHRHQEFLAFLKQVARAYPDQQLHLVMDNYAAHKHPAVGSWLADNPRVVVHFTPTHASWTNLVEVWFGIIERQAIHRGTFGSVRDLNGKIRSFIAGWNDRCRPFVWTKTVDQILNKANRPQTSETGY